MNSKRHFREKARTSFGDHILVSVAEQLASCWVLELEGLMALAETLTPQGEVAMRRRLPSPRSGSQFDASAGKRTGRTPLWGRHHIEVESQMVSTIIADHLESVLLEIQYASENIAHHAADATVSSDDIDKSLMEALETARGVLEEALSLAQKYGVPKMAIEAA